MEMQSQMSVEGMLFYINIVNIVKSFVKILFNIVIKMSVKIVVMIVVRAAVKIV